MHATMASFTEYTTLPHLAVLPGGSHALASLHEAVSFRIVGFQHSDAEITMVRLGIGVGDTLRLVSRLPGKGPLILEYGGSEFALGVQYAAQIQVVLD
jgi:Fe2+ transport system protein FeoA